MGSEREWRDWHRGRANSGCTSSATQELLVLGKIRTAWTKPRITCKIRIQNSGDLYLVPGSKVS